MSSLNRRRALASLQGAAGLVSVPAVLRAKGQAHGPAQGPKVWVEICRLFKERPDAIGLAVPRMPLGSPGMDGPADNNRQVPCDVLLIARDGSTQVFNSYFKQKERS